MPERSAKPSLLGGVQRFPVTVILALQYVPLVLVQGYAYDSPRLGFLFKVVGIAIASSFVVEMLLNPLRKPPADITDEEPVKVRFAVLVTAVGAAAVVLAAHLGQGSFAVQVGAQSRSPLVTLLTPFHPWLVVGSAYLIAARIQGLLAPRRLLFLLACSASAQLYAALVQAITQPFLSYLVAIGVVALLLGAIRIRTLLLLGVLVVIAFPMIGSVRNQMRAELGAAQFANQEFTFQTRLREDLNLADAARLPTDHEYGELSFIQATRMGLLPRFLDPGRPELASGKIISQSLNRSSLSSSTLTTAGALWVFAGPTGLALYFGAASALASILMRRLTPARVALLAVVVYTLLLIERTYPESYAGFLQSSVSAFAAILYMKHVSIRQGRAEQPA